MEESIICLEDSTEIIDLCETIGPPPQHSRDELFDEFFVREKRMRTRSRTKKMNEPPAEVIDLSNETDLSDNSFESEREKRRSIELSCPICFESLSKVQVKATTCGHVFCSQCIEFSIKEKKTCPKCRKKLTLKSIIPLYL